MSYCNPLNEYLNLKFKLKSVYFLVGSIFFAYVFVRAFSVGATIDEITTMQGARELSFLDIIFQTHPTANSHVLNTILIKTLFFLGGDSLAIVRSPNVLSLILYLYWAYKIASKRLPRFVGIGCFTLLMCNPFLLDFFGLARGYGISLGFMMGALYFGSEFFESRSKSNFLKALVFSSLSVYSLFSMIYFWVALASMLTMVPFLRKDWACFKSCLFYGVLTGATLLGAIAVPIFHLKESGSLYYGGHDSLYSDTLISLTRYSLYSIDITSSVYVTLNIFLVTLLSVSIISYSKGEKWRSLKTLFLGAGVVSATLIILAHHLAGVLYPINRVGLFLYPLFIFSLCFCLKDFRDYMRTTAIFLLLIVFGINFISKGNFYRTALWSFDAHTEDILNQVNERGGEIGRVIYFACTPVIYHSVNYYSERNDYEFLEVIQDENQLVPDGIDYYLFSDRDTAAFSEESYIERSVLPLDAYDKSVFIAYPDDHLFVFENLRKH